MKNKLQNTFKTSEPVAHMRQPVIPEERRHDFMPKTLTPPVFQEERVSMWNHNIAYSQTLVKVVDRGIKL